VHAIYASKHAEKLSFLFDHQESSCVLNSRISQINIMEHINDCLATPVHSLNACGITHGHVLINDITGNSIRKHVNSYRALLVRSEANLALEVGVMEPHSFEDAREQCPRHPKAALELTLVQQGVRPKVVAVDMDVANLPILVQIGCSARHRPYPCLNMLVVLVKEGCHRNQDVAINVEILV
jgi:hypothetical protein